MRKLAIGFLCALVSVTVQAQQCRPQGLGDPLSPAQKGKLIAFLSSL